MAETPKRVNIHHHHHQQQHHHHRSLAVVSTPDSASAYNSARQQQQQQSAAAAAAAAGSNGINHNINNNGAASSSFSTASSTHGGAGAAVIGAVGVVAGSSSAKRMYRTAAASDNNRWVTRDIASLDFLLGIPLAAEREIVSTGWQLQCQKDDDAMMGADGGSQTSNDTDPRGTVTKRNNNINHSSTAAAAAATISTAASTNHTKQQQQPQQPVPKGTWWGKWIQQPSNVHSSAAASFNNSSKHGSSADNSTTASNIRKQEAAELERPTPAVFLPPQAAAATMAAAQPHYAPPGRRLEGDAAVRVQIPLGLGSRGSSHAAAATANVTVFTRQRSIARQAALREWEQQVAHGVVGLGGGGAHQQQQQQPPLLDGRLFFSSDSSYPVSVFSMIRYEPKREEAAIRRRKLEAVGGGGSQFVLPKRDWRGISYRALLPRTSSDDHARDKVAFNRFVRDDDEDEKKNGPDDDELSSSSESSEDSDVYAPGLLDDPNMVLGRHRTVMIGDAVTGPIVSSSIQFVKPALLKEELNKQFRERFDGWEPPKSARKYIGAKVIQGNYVLMDPAEEHDDQSYEQRRRKRQESLGSVNSFSSDGPQEKVIRMPPSLTLSKIRSLKRQALSAAVKAKLEIGTVALACVYFERLCLDCRVDKSNRRIAFAACLLLAMKLNEPNVGLVTYHDADESGSDDDVSTLQYLIRPNKRSSNMYASLLLFFTQDWSLSLKALFDTEWAVFAALGFSLHASPSQAAFHFKRLMKTLDWNPLDYLGTTMYNQWQKALADEEERRAKRERRREVRRKRKEEQLLNLHIEIENEYRRKNERHNNNNESDESPKNQGKTDEVDEPVISESQGGKKKIGIERRIKLFNRFARPVRRTVSQERLKDMENQELATTEHEPATRRRSTGIHFSPSMPAISTVFAGEDTGIVAIDIPLTNNNETDSASSIGSHNETYKAGIII